MSDDSTNEHDPDDAMDIDDAQLEELFRLVGRAFAEGDSAPPPESGGMSYVRWSSPDADLAVMFETELEGVRDDGEVGVDLEFRGARYQISVSISVDSIVGEVSPWETGTTLRLEFEGGPMDIDVDEDGEFYVPSPPGGPVRLRVESAEGAMVTEWFTVNPSRSS
jgi:hypothetical protein